MTPAQMQALLRTSQSAAKYGGYGSAASGLGNLSSGLGIYGGLEQGGVGGYGSAAANSAKLAGSLSGNKALSQYGAGAGNLLGIYGGIKQGGVGGYTGAGVNAAQLGASTGAFGSASGAIGNAAGYAAIPLSLYNEVNSWESGNTGADALGGAGTGAAIGTMVLPGIGTAVGALLGAAAGALSSAFGSGRVDPENANFEGYTQAYNKAAKEGGGAAANKVSSGEQNPYLPLAGYFDLRPQQLKGDNPLYSTYGRMGEQKFTNDLTSHIDDAFKSGQLAYGANGSLVQKNPGGGSTTYTNPSDIAGEVYNNAVAPWVSGLGNWNDSNKDAMTGLIKQMTGQYISGQAANDWKSRGGQSPFSNIYQNSPLIASAQAAQAQQHPQAPIAQPQQPAIPQDIFKTPGMGGATTALGAARGGHVRKVHFDDGGSYDWGSFSEPTLSDPGSSYFDSDNPFSSYSQDIGDNSNIVNAYNDPYAYGYSDPTTGNSSGSTSGGLANLLKAFGVSGSTANSLAPYAALAPILGSMLGMNKNQSKAPSLPSQYGGQALNMATPNFTRQQNNLSGMSMKDWLHAGEGPEIQYYRNNALPATQMSAPNQQAAQALSAATGQPFAGGYQYAPIAGSGQTTVGGVAPSATSAPTANIQPIDLSKMPVMAAGGPYDSPDAAYGTSAVGHVRGPGDGTSDSIRLRNAYLSNGEYVMDAPTVSLIGAGSNDAGAKKLDAFRVHVRKNAGRHMIKGKQPMQGADPAAYFYGGAV